MRDTYVLIILTCTGTTIKIARPSVDGERVRDIWCAARDKGLIVHIDHIGVPPLACTDNIFFFLLIIINRILTKQLLFKKWIVHRQKIKRTQIRTKRRIVRA